MLDVVTFKWETPGYRSKFTAVHVNTMRSMIARNYPHPFRFHIVTDRPHDFYDAGCIVHELWDDHKDLPSPHGGNNPSCYRRLKLWSPWAVESFGPRILQIDLDMVITGDVSSLWNRPEDVVMWKDNLNPTSPYNGAMQLFSPLTRPQVWRDFDPVKSPAKALARQYWGSDQGWLALALGPDEARWTSADGALSWRVHCKQNTKAAHRLNPDCVPLLPDGAKVVNFHGHEDPWDLRAVVPWIAELYR